MIDNPRTTPGGELYIQTLAMPMNTNANGDIFGGWLVSQMDLAGGIFARQYSSGRAVTVAINRLNFLLPVSVGDLLSCHVQLLKHGDTSITLAVEAWKQTFVTSETHCVAAGEFVFVAIDEAGQPRKVNNSL